MLGTSFNITRREETDDIVAHGLENSERFPNQEKDLKVSSYFWTYYLWPRSA